MMIIHPPPPTYEYEGVYAYEDDGGGGGEDNNDDFIDFDSSPYQDSSQGLGAPPLSFQDKKMKKIR